MMNPPWDFLKELKEFNKDEIPESRLMEVEWYVPRMRCPFPPWILESPSDPPYYFKQGAPIFKGSEGDSRLFHLICVPRQRLC